MSSPDSIIGWKFPQNDGGISAGFNDSSIDHFAGQRLSSLLREVIQNSLDAKKDPLAPVKVTIDRVQLRCEECREVGLLKKPLEKSRQAAEQQGIRHAVEFYDNALSMLASETCDMLCIHDANTSGLEGPMDGPGGSWFALTKGAGLSQKPAGALGSFGHGSKAPFSMSSIRSVFYYTQIEGGREDRFQGKSILQSHWDEASESWTQGTGFYGTTDGCRGLQNREVPKWAKKLRSSVTHSDGTTLYIPITQYKNTQHAEAALTVIANFFFAIYTGILEVVISDEYELTKDTVENAYLHLKERLAQRSDEIDTDYLGRCFESVETILYPSEYSTQEIPSIGLVEWYIRIGNGVEGRHVSVARANGMLITRSAPRLVKFFRTKEFDIFVCVKGEEGSKTLRAIENPQHDNFQFDRIADKKERKKIERKYKQFSDKIRDLIDRYAGLEVGEEVLVSELSHLFADLSSESTGGEDSRERGEAFSLSLGEPTRVSSTSRTARYAADGTAWGEVPGRGVQGGRRKKKTSGGSVPGESGETTTKGPAKTSRAGRDVYRLSDLRVVQIPGNPKTAEVFFTVPRAGSFRLELFRSGEDGAAAIPIVMTGTESGEVRIQVDNAGRESVKVDAKEGDFDAALEGTLHAIP